MILMDITRKTNLDSPGLSPQAVEEWLEIDMIIFLIL